MAEPIPLSVSFTRCHELWPRFLACQNREPIRGWQSRNEHIVFVYLAPTGAGLLSQSSAMGRLSVEPLLSCVYTAGATLEYIDELRNGDRLSVEGFRMKEVEPKYFGEGRFASLFFFRTSRGTCLSKNVVVCCLLASYEPPYRIASLHTPSLQTACSASDMRAAISVPRTW